MDGIDVKKPMYRELSKASTMVMEFRSSTVPGALQHRMGPLGTEFAADAAIMPHPEPDSLGSYRPEPGNRQDQDPQ